MAGVKCIGFIVREFPPVKGGIARLTEDLVRLASRDIPIVVLLTGEQQNPPRCFDNVRYVALGKQPSDACVFETLRDYDVSHVVFNHMQCARLPLIWKCYRARIPMWTMVYGADINLRVKTNLGIKIRFQRYWQFRLQKGAVACSRSTQRIFRRKIGCVPSHVLLPGIWSEAFRDVSADHSAAKEGRGIVSVGRLIRRKGFDVLLDAVQRLPPEIMLTIIGDGPERDRLQDQARELGISDRVRFLHGLSDVDVLAALKSHRVFCQLPRELQEGDIEGFGIVFLEAAACGLPVVAGNSGGVSDAVSDGLNGFLVDPANPSEIADRLFTVLFDDSVYQGMRDGARQWIQRFDWESRSIETEFSFMSAQR